MARDYTILSSQNPSAIAHAKVHIAHVQLRDLIICPRERGLVNYVQYRSIVEQNLHASGAPTRTLALLPFSPNSLTSLAVGPSEADTLIAAGGQEAEIHLSYHTPSTSRAKATRLAWKHDVHLSGSINNSVLLTSLSLATSHESSVEPRVGISNNDCSFKLYDIPMRVPSSRRKLVQVGQVRLDVPINHSSISPDGRTLLSVGDSNKIFCHQISGSSSRISFTPITTLTLPPPDFPPSATYTYPNSSLAASFSTAFSGDGSKFAVASQEGVVAVWDVRSTRPIKVFQTDKSRLPAPLMEGNGSATGWLSEDPWEWTRGTKAPGWCVRSVKFNGGAVGKEVMTFTEHTNLIHIVDARTFEKDEVLRVPTINRPSDSSSSRVKESRRSTTATHGNSNANGAGSSSSSSTPSPTLPIAATSTQLRLRRNQMRRLGLLNSLPPLSHARREGPPGSTPAPGSGSGSASTSSRQLVLEELARMRREHREREADGNAVVDNTSDSVVADEHRRRIRRRLPTRAELGHNTASTSDENARRLRLGRRLLTRSETERRRPELRTSTSEPAGGAGADSSADMDRSTLGAAEAIQALGDTFMIELPTSSSSSVADAGGSNARSVPGSGSSTSPAVSSARTRGTSNFAAASIASAPPETTAYAAPASIGDSTWRTLGGAWPVRGGSTGGAENLASSSASTSGSNATSTPAAGSGSTTNESTGAAAADNIVIFPHLGDPQMDTDLRALLRLHPLVSDNYGPSPDANGIHNDDGTNPTSPSVALRTTHPTDDFLDVLDLASSRTDIDSLADAIQNNDPHVGWSDDLSAPFPDYYDELHALLTGPNPFLIPEEDDDMNTGSTHGDYEYRLGGRRGVGYRRDGRSGVGYVPTAGGPGGEGVPGGVEGMDVDLDLAVELDNALDRRLERDLAMLSAGGENEVDTDGSFDVDFDLDVDMEGDERPRVEDDDEEGEEERGRRDWDGAESMSECGSSAANSRSASPTRIAGSSSSIRQGESGAPSTSPSSRRYGTLSTSASAPAQTGQRSHGHRRRPADVSLNGFTPQSIFSPDSTKRPPKYYTLGEGGIYGYHEELDIAGVCFDPSGERLYVANGVQPNRNQHNLFGGYGSYGYSEEDEGDARVGAVVEWEVKGAEKRWWVEEGWR